MIEGKGKGAVSEFIVGKEFIQTATYIFPPDQVLQLLESLLFFFFFFFFSFVD